MEKIIEKAKVLYDYLNIPCDLKNADIIIGLGCMDMGIPNKCSSLYKEGYGKQIVFSGNVGKGTEGVLEITEAERFKNIAVEKGIPEKDILLEKDATNTYENYKFTKKLLENSNYNFDSVIIVQKPYVKRRCLAIADVELKGKAYYVSSEDLTFEEFVKQSEDNNTMNLDEIINEMVGEISIIMEAPKYNLQSFQPMSKDVLSAYNFLLDKGYTKYIVTSKKIEFIIKRWSELGIIKSNIL